MLRNHPLRELTAVVVLAYAVSAWATPAIVEIGGTKLVIPAPPTLTNTRPDAGKFFNEGMQFVTAKSRLLALFVTPKSISEYKAGNKSPYWPRYATVTTQINNELRQITPQQFAETKESLKNTFGLVFTPEFINEVNSREVVKKAGSRIKTMDRPVVVSTSTNHLSFASKMNVATKGTSSKMLVITTVASVKGKILMMYYYFDTPTDADLNASGSLGLKWAKDLLDANGVTN